jgi:hypothetical protein
MKDNKTLKKESEKDTRRWKGLPHSWIRINIMKMSILPKSIDSMKFPSKSHVILHRNRKINLKFIWKHKRPQLAKVILSKKSNTRGFTKYWTLNYTIEPQ